MKDTIIIAFTFGAPFDIPPNMRLAGVASAESRLLGADIFTQKDLQDINGMRLGGSLNFIEEGKDPPPTLRIARWAIQEMPKTVKCVSVVAAKPHIWRAIRDTKRALCEVGRSNVAIIVPCAISESKWSWWFCKESTQKGTQTPWNWLKREFILRIMPFWVYKKLAS